MSDLAGFANSSLSRLSRAVTRLQNRGRVERSQDPEDGRSTLATLTSKDLEVLEDATPDHVGTVRRLVLDPLTPAQKRHLRELTLRIQHAVRTEQGWRPPRSPAPSTAESLHA